MSRYPQICDERGRIESDVQTGSALHYSEIEALVDLAHSRTPADQWRRETVREFIGLPIPPVKESVRYQKTTRLDDGRLWCSCCQTHLEPNAFSRDKRNVVRGRRWYCKQCETERASRRYHLRKLDRVLAMAG